MHGEDGRYHARSEVEVPLVKAEALVRLLLSKTVAEARACLPSLGLTAPLDLHHLCGVLEKYAVVCLGPMSCRMWKLSGPPPVACPHSCLGQAGKNS